MLHKIAKCKYEAKLLSRKNKTTNKKERMNNEQKPSVEKLSCTFEKLQTPLFYICS